jgi:hypothetical protein
MSEARDARVLNEPPVSAFYEFVRSALATHGVGASPEAEYYLVNLLAGFLRARPERFARALGPELLAASRLDPVHRSVRLRDVGDTTLFLTGIFLDHIEAKPAATEYYFSIGRTAYGRLAELAGTSGALAVHAPTFAELSGRFVEFVRVLSAIADRELFSGSERLMAVYQRWLATGNPRDTSRLIAQGVIPATSGNTSH